MDDQTTPLSKDVYELISIQTDDPIVERKTCATSGAEFALFASDQQFYKKISPTFAGEHFPVPFPTLCPEERQKRRLVWRGKDYFSCICDKTGRKCLSIRPPDAEMTTYSHEAFYADDWNGLERGRDIDFSRSFFEQFNDLRRVTPKHIANAFDNENSQFIINGHKNKSCYMTDETDFSQHCYYGYGMQNCVSCVDCLYIKDCQRCYEVIQGENCYQVFYSHYVYTCHDSAFVKNSYGCEFCLFCNDLQNASYHVFNRPVSKEEFEQLRAIIFNGTKTSIADAQQKFEIFLREQPFPARVEKQCEKCVGHNLLNCKGCILSFNIDNCENCKYCLDIHESRNCQDVDIYIGELMYEGLHVGPDGYKHLFSHLTRYCQDVYYCSQMFNCKHCFGCSGLKDQQYCIFNKKYEKQDYEKIVAQLIHHMIKNNERGEFFPSRYSPYDYNQTLASLHHPLIASQAQKQGFTRADESQVTTDLASIVPGPLAKYQKTEQREKLLVSVIHCKSSKKYFKITSQELAFYELFNLLLPLLHPMERDKRRRQDHSARQLYSRMGDHNGEQVISVYPPDTAYKVYSQQAYKQLFG